MRAFPFLLLAVSLLFSACAVESVRPLSSPRTAMRDPRLEGMWRTVGEKNQSYAYFSYGEKSNIGSALMIDKDKAGLSTISADFFVTRTPRHSYLNITHVVSRNHSSVTRDYSHTYVFMEYHFSLLGDMVTALVLEKVFKDAIAQGKIHGSAKKSSSTLVDDSAERVLSLIESSKPKDVFGKWSRFRKIGRP